MRTGHRANDIEGVVAVRRPVPKGLVHRILQRGTAFRNSVDLRAQHPHTVDVRSLSLNVNRTHKDLALHAEQRSDGGCCHTVHARTRLGNETLLAHPPR